MRTRRDIKPNSPTFAHMGDFDIESVRVGSNRGLRDASPGHTEIWTFGWTPKFYRSYYPLYPLPTISIFPFIKKYLNENKPHPAPDFDIIADVRAEHGAILFKRTDNSSPCDNACVTSFISPKELKEIGTRILSFKPPSYSPALYLGRIRGAIKQAILEKEAHEQAMYRLQRQQCRRYRRAKTTDEPAPKVAENHSS